MLSRRCFAVSGRVSTVCRRWFSFCVVMLPLAMLSTVQHATSKPNTFRTSDLCEFTGLSRSQIAREAARGEIPGASRRDGVHFDFAHSPELRSWMMERRHNRHHKRTDWTRFLEDEGTPRPIWGDADRVAISAIYTLGSREPEDLVRRLGVESAKRLVYALQAGARLADAIEAELPRDPQSPNSEILKFPGHPRAPSPTG